jgi:iron complex transport system ATP-binding protein
MSDEKKITAIEAINLSYAYQDNDVFKDMSFSVPKGGFFIIIGPNGSGKTTLMKVLSGVEKPGRGKLHIMGKAVEKYSRKSLAQTLAMAPQMTNVDFPFTVIEIVLMGRSPYKGLLGLDNQADLRIAQQAMAFTGVEHLAGRKLGQLSGGEQQRVLIARAICQEPEIILLDEPTASLDLAHQVRVMDLMEQLQKEKGVTVIMVSHDINLACMYAQSLLLIKNGQIVSSGPPNQVLNYETLEQAYGCPLLVDQSPLGNFPRITLVPKRFINSSLVNSYLKNKSSENSIFH